jgi:hypothetical protein
MPLQTSPALRASSTNPNTSELAFPLSEWVLFVMHGDTVRTYLAHPASYTLNRPSLDDQAFAIDEDRFGPQT